MLLPLLSFVGALGAAPLLLVVAPADSGHVEAARTAAVGLEVEGYERLPRPACAAQPACVAGGVPRGDAVLWTREVLGADGAVNGVVVTVVRRPDGASIVEELVVDGGAGIAPEQIAAAVGRVSGQVGSGLARLATTSPLAVAAVPVGSAPPPPAPVGAAVEPVDEGIPATWWVVGGIGVAVIIAAVVVGVVVLNTGERRTPDGGTTDNACNSCVDATFGNCIVCTGITDSIDGACNSACTGFGDSLGDSCSGIGDGIGGACDGLGSIGTACDGLGSIGSCATAPATPLTPGALPQPSTTLPAPSSSSSSPSSPDGRMAW